LVGLGIEVVEADARRLSRIGRGELHPAAALRAHDPHGEHEALGPVGDGFAEAGGQCIELVLDVGVVDPGAQLGPGLAIVRVDRLHPTGGQLVAPGMAVPS